VLEDRSERRKPVSTWLKAFPSGYMLLSNQQYGKQKNIEIPQLFNIACTVVLSII
jgi:tellurite resistance protein TehA-like permease